ncbi:MAG: MMPL family transporter [Pirellulales bacterium]
MRRLVEAHDPSGVVAGEPVMVVDGFANIDHDGGVLGWTSTVLLSLTLLLCFRRLRWVVVPLVVVNVTLVWTRALLVATGLKLSMVSSMLWAIVTVIGVAMVVHVIVRFRDALADGLAPIEALTSAARRLALPIALSCATDALAFGALLKARVGPVQDFGKMMAAGSLLAMLSVATVAPTLMLLGYRAEAVDATRADDRLRRLVSRLLGVVERRPGWIVAASLALLALALAGYPQLQVESDFTRNFRADSEIATSYAFVEERLGGAGVWEVILPAPAQLDWEYLGRVRALEVRLRDEVVVTNAAGVVQPGLTKVLSAVDVFDAILGPLAGRLPAAMVMQQTERMMPGIATLFRGQEPGAEGETYLRILLRARERQSAEQKAGLIADVERICREEFPPAEVTGFFVLLASLIDSMLQDQWVTFAIAVVLIGGMMWLGLGRVRLAVVALIPNALPIIVVMGTIAWFGVPINMGAAMVAAVSMGLSIDSTTHLMVEYRRGRDAGLSAAQAIAAANLAVGPAILLSTLALVVGFSAMCLSQFVPTIYFGVLVSLSMIGGMIANLVLLPVLLTAIEPRADA